MAKRRAKKVKRDIRLEVSWNFDHKNDPDISFERTLEKIVKVHGGREVGSGAGMGRRDISYDRFDSLADVAFAKGHLVTVLRASGRKKIETSITIETKES